jgi:hypothetical protein
MGKGPNVSTIEYIYEKQLTRYLAAVKYIRDIDTHRELERAGKVTISDQYAVIDAAKKYDAATR